MASSSGSVAPALESTAAIFVPSSCPSFVSSIIFNKLAVIGESRYVNPCKLVGAPQKDCLGEVLKRGLSFPESQSLNALHGTQMFSIILNNVNFSSQLSRLSA